MAPAQVKVYAYKAWGKEGRREGEGTGVQPGYVRVFIARLWPRMALLL
jgi:hypothetical protein